MNLPAVLEPVPLILTEADQVVRVAGTRVTLDTIVRAFQRGATPEEIAQDYSAVSLPDIYAVIAYYLRHRSEVDEYLQRREREHGQLEREIKARPEYQEFRDRLLARVQAARAEPA